MKALLLPLLVVAVALMHRPSSACLQTTISLASVSMTHYYTNITCCGIFCWTTCSMVQSKTVYVSGYIISYKCCPGYGPGHPTCDPICNNTCDENFVCSAPDTCTCAPGWTGEDCSIDINECEEHTDQCEDRCTNIPGQYLCSCYNKNDKLARDGYRCLSGVTNITTVARIRELTLSWTLPHDYDEDGNFTGLLVTCNEKQYFTNVTTEATLYSLTPFTNYTCCITPKWSSDSGPVNCTTSITLQDAPHDSPHIVTLLSVSSTEMIIQWKPPLIVNGLISHYTLYTNYTNGSDISTTIIDSQYNRFILRWLSPYQLVGVSLSATTGGGEGPLSVYKFNRTDEAGPGAVQSIEIEVLVNTAVRITWSKPLVPNGIITGYNVIVSSLTSDARFEKKKEIIQGDLLTTHITELEPYVPYSANITAMTRGGEGAVSTKIFYTAETVPNVSPRILSAYKDTPTSIDVKWSQLSLEESRGFVTKYTITLSLSIDHCNITTSEQEVVVSGGNDSYRFTQLEPARNYCISISASTVAGDGKASPLQNVYTFEHSRVAIYLTGIENCSIWTQSETRTKLNDLEGTLLHLLLLQCNCPINQNHIFNSHFELCNDEDLVGYATAILGTVPVNSSKLVRIIENWGATNPKIVVEGVQLIVVSVCDLNHIDETKCHPHIIPTVGGITPGNKHSLYTILGFTIGTLILVLLMAIITVTVLCFWMHSKTRKLKRMYYISQRDNVEEVKHDEDSDAGAITDNNVYEEPHGLELHVMQRHQRLRMETEI